MNDTEKRDYIITATLTLRGALMFVEASSEDEAREIAKSNPDFETNVAELTGFSISKIELNT